MLETKSTAQAICLADGDTVGVALADLNTGDLVSISGELIKLRTSVPKGHKFALRDHGVGEAVRKFGADIGLTTAAIGAGEHVHSHNLRSALTGVRDYTYAPSTQIASLQTSPMPGFTGYKRASGRTGTRNEIWIIATVGCVAKVCSQIATLSSARHSGRIDGIHAITHPFGCSQLGGDLEDTRNILAALASHPNAGGVVIVGLGCESNQLDALLAAAPQIDRTRLRTVRAQSESDEIEAGLAAVDELVALARTDLREACPASELVIGLKCGGSDGFSGLTANPLIGRLSDRLTAAGGTAILTEIPEIFGAEHTLMARAASREVFDAIGTLTNRFKTYFTDHDQPVSENPSPGNKDGGITTLEEKSLGAVQKSGQSPVTDVIGYAACWRVPGVTLLEAPGNDAVSGTALAAAGATVILFTTGRGTPLGFPVPTVKIASNAALAKQKSRWIDFDAGQILETGDWNAVDTRLTSLVFATAGGESTRNEINDERSIAIWKRGVTL